MPGLIARPRFFPAVRYGPAAAAVAAAVAVGWAAGSPPGPVCGVAAVAAVGGWLAGRRGDGRPTRGEVDRLTRDLKHRADELQALMDLLPVGVGVARDPGCRRIDTNPAMDRLLETPGLDPSVTGPDAARLPFAVHHAGRPCPADQLPMQRTAATGVPIDRWESDVHFADGRVRHLLVSTAPLFDPAGRPRGCVAGFVDVTDLKQARRALDRYRLLSEHARDIVLFVRPDGRIAEANAAAEAAYGYPRADLVRLSVADLRHPDHRADAAARLAAADAAGGTFEAVHRRRDGTPFPVEVSARGADAGGERLILEIVRDVTDRKRAEADLRESEARFRHLADAAPALIWVCDEHHQGTWFNRGWLTFTGRPLAAELGDGWADRVHPDDAAEARDRCLQAFRRRQPHAGEFRLLRHDGEYRWVWDQGVPRFAPDGTFLGYVGTCLDITARKQAEADLRASEARFRLLAAVADATQPLTDPDAITAAVARVLGDHLAVDRCAYAEADADEDHFTVTGDYCRGPVPSIAGRYAMSDFGTPVRDAMRAGTPWVVSDIATDPRVTDADRAAYRATHIRAVICLPLLKAGRFVAAMAVHTAAPRTWAAAEVALVRVVVDRCWESIERARTARALAESEERFRHMADATPALVWVSGPHKGCTWFNRAWLEFTGRPLAHELGDGWVGGVHPDDRPRCLGTYAAAVGGRRPFDMDYRLRRHDGEYRWVLDRGVPRFAPDGTFAGYIGACIDVTDRKRAEQAVRFLADAGAALAGLTDPDDALAKVVRVAVPGFADWATVHLADPDGRLRLAAAAAADPAAEAAAWAYDRRHPLDPAGRSGPARAVRTGAVVAEAVTPAVLDRLARTADHRRDMAALDLRSYVSVPLTVGGRPAGAVTFATAAAGRVFDDTDRRLAEELAGRAAVALDNARLYREAQDASRRRDEFLAMLAHELRNPLAPIRTGLAILKVVADGPPDGPAAKARAAIERQVEHLVRLVDDLLDVGRVVRGKIRLRRDRVDLAAVVARAVETAQPLVDAHRHRLTVAAPADPVWVAGDEVRLTQVFANLLTNAARYTAAGGHIRVAVAAAGGWAEVRVADTGRGLPADMLGRVFELFVQVDAESDPGRGGLGIGLTLVKTLVELHGGTVTAHSDGPGTGSEFVVRLGRG